MKLYPDMELIINHDFQHREVIVYGQVFRDGRLFIIGYDGERYIEQEVTRENEMNAMISYKPLLNMTVWMFDGFVKAVLDYANKKDIHTENENTIQGKLTATETHLKDMQELTKKLTDAVIVKLTK